MGRSSRHGCSWSCSHHLDDCGCRDPVTVTSLRHASFTHQSTCNMCNVPETVQGSDSWLLESGLTPSLRLFTWTAAEAASQLSRNHKPAMLIDFSPHASGQRTKKPEDHRTLCAGGLERMLQGEGTLKAVYCPCTCLGQAGLKLSAWRCLTESVWPRVRRQTKLNGGFVLFVQTVTATFRSARKPHWSHSTQSSTLKKLSRAEDELLSEVWIHHGPSGVLKPNRIAL